MFGFASTPSTAAGNRRVNRVNQLRQQRLAASNQAKITSPSKASTKASTGAATSTEDNDDDAIVVSGMCTVFCALFIVVLGAAMATIFFILNRPECLKGISFGVADLGLANMDVQQTLDAPKSTGLRRLEAKPQVEDFLEAAAAASVAAMAIEPFLPSQCTPAQLKQLAAQLPLNGCDRERTVCNTLSLATSCSDPFWFRQHYANRQQDFVSIHVGCDNGYQAMDMLAVGTKDFDTYDGELWRQAFVEQLPEIVQDHLEPCPRATIASNLELQAKAKATAYCIEPVPQKFQRLQNIKNKLTVGNQLQLVQLAIRDTQGEVLIRNKEPLDVEQKELQSSKDNPCTSKNSQDCELVPMDTLDHWIISTPLGPKNPIHYLSLKLSDHDHVALVGATTTLNRVHYLDLHLQWSGNTGFQNLQDTIDKLQENNFACYFAGNGNLWRITGCWQDHYQQVDSANIACVNTRLTEPLAREMEEVFQRALKMEQGIGNK